MGRGDGLSGTTHRWLRRTCRLPGLTPWNPVPPRPGVPRHLGRSRAVADAYAAGTPLRLALYESDWAYHSGNTLSRPTRMSGKRQAGRPWLSPGASPSLV